MPSVVQIYQAATSSLLKNHKKKLNLEVIKGQINKIPSKKFKFMHVGLLSIIAWKDIFPPKWQGDVALVSLYPVDTQRFHEGVFGVLLGTVKII